MSCFCYFKHSQRLTEAEMKSFNVLVLILALSILLAATIGACKDGVARKRIIIRTRRRCKTSSQSSAKRLKNDAKTVKVLGKKLKNALKLWREQWQSEIDRDSQDDTGYLETLVKLADTIELKCG